MIRVVLDTNIIVSAYLNQEGLPFSILKLALAGPAALRLGTDPGRVRGATAAQELSPGPAQGQTAP